MDDVEKAKISVLSVSVVILWCERVFDKLTYILFNTSIEVTNVNITLKYTIQKQCTNHKLSGTTEHILFKFWGKLFCMPLRKDFSKLYF